MKKKNDKWYIIEKKINVYNRFFGGDNRFRVRFRICDDTPILQDIRGYTFTLNELNQLTKLLKKEIAKYNELNK